MEAMGLKALGFLAQNADDLGRFLSITGLHPGSLREAAAAPGFLRGVLSYLVGDEDLLVRFAVSEGMRPDAIGRAVMSLDDPGQD